MSFWENIIIRRLKRYLPDWSDAESTRLFFLRIVPFLEDFAEGTATKLDDMAVDGLEAVLSDPARWAAIYALFGFEGTGAPLAADDPYVVAAADKTELSPTIIIAIISLAAQIFSFWRNR